MKKIKIFLAALAVAALFVGCSKEPRSLDGTVWEYTAGDTVGELTFTKSQCRWSLYATDGSGDYYQTYYSYEYTAPTVMMYPEEDGMAVLKGIITENQMSIVNTSTGKTLGVYILK